MSNNKNQKISSAELSIFCGQVALILEAGLPLYDGMETLAGTGTNSENAEMFQAASKGVTDTGSLYEALKDDPRWPEYMVEMVGIGERSGHLESIMRGLETYVTTTHEVNPYDGWTNKFIFPPYQYSVPDAIVSNFHLPQSTMLMSVAAFGGYKGVMAAYEEALKEGYRFGPYGDALLIL